MLDALFRWLALVAIRAYRRWISPYKGFRCAHRARHGGPSCSDYGLAAVSAHGFWEALRLIRARLAACRVAASDLAAGQDGFCDTLACERECGCDQADPCVTGPQACGS